jgi:hypothetical protein
VDSFASDLRVKRCVSIVASLAFVLTAIALVPEHAAAQGFPKDVIGTVRDQAGTPVQGALVIVKMFDGTTEKSSHSDTTNTLGRYTTTFGGTEWSDGWTINVSATYNSQTETNNAICDDAPIQTVDVTFTFEIPEFGTMLGIVVAGLALGIVAVAVLSRKQQ